MTFKEVFSMEVHPKKILSPDVPVQAVVLRWKRKLLAIGHVEALSGRLEVPPGMGKQTWRWSTVLSYLSC